MLCAVCCKGVRMALSSLTDAYATGGVAAADPVGPCANAKVEASKAIKQTRIFREFNMGSHCVLLFVHIS